MYPATTSCWRQGWAGGFQHEVQMFGHEAKGMHLPIGLLACFPKRAEETLSILVVFEDSLPAITAIDDVLHRAGVLDAQLARHSGRLLRESQLCQEDF